MSGVIVKATKVMQVKGRGDSRGQGDVRLRDKVLRSMDLRDLQWHEDLKWMVTLRGQVEGEVMVKLG
eukprot:c265_g1_i1 orf=3-200(-)